MLILINYAFDGSQFLIIFEKQQSKFAYKNMKYETVHIGSKIAEALEARKMNNRQFSVHLGMNPNNGRRLLLQTEMRPEVLRKISILFDHDFFQYLIANETKAALSVPAIAPQTEAATGDIDKQLLVAEITRLKLEVEYLKEINALLKGK